MAVIEAYFDESYADSGEPLCVAGYGFRKTKARALDKNWKRLLKKYDLPFFRMSACAHHNPPFDRLTKEQCEDVARAAIELIRKYADRGFAVTVDEKDFEARVPPEGLAVHGGAYEFCVWNCLMGVRK